MPKHSKVQSKSKKFDFSDSDESSVEEKSSKSLKNGNIYRYFTKKNHGSDSSNDSDSDDDRRTNLKCYGRDSYSTSYSSSSGSGEEKYYGKQKKIEKQPQIENKDVQTIVYGFSVLANTKNPKREFLTVTSKDLRVEKCTNESDIETSSKFIKSASPHSDIVLSLTVRNLKSEYNGMVSLEFPTVNCLNGEKSVGFAPFVSKTTQHGDLTLKNGSTYELIKRDLTEEQQEFLKKYPGHTLETFENFSNPIGSAGKSFHVNIEPKSCLLEYYDGKQKQLNLKNNEKVLVMDAKEHGKCVKQASNYLEKEFAFSNVTGKDFKMQIRPVMNSTVKKNIDSQIQKIKSKSTDDDILKSLQAKGFANYYNNHPFTEKDKFDESFTKFKNSNFIFSGEIEIKYQQVKELNQK